MYIDSITFWTTTLSGIIVGLVVGGILGRIGYFIWKRQNDYSKRQDAYLQLMNTLYPFTANMLNYFEKKEEFDVNNFRASTAKEQINLLEKRTIFLFYFTEEEYRESLEDIIKKYSDITHNREINMTFDEFELFILERLGMFSNIKVK